MFRSNIKYAIRSLTKNSAYSLINILGLTVGIAAVLLLYRMISFEYSFNQDFANFDRIGRVVLQELNSSDNSEFSPGMPIPAMAVIEETVPGLASTARIREFWPNITIAGESPEKPLKKFGLDRESTPLMVEPAFMQIFDFAWETTAAIDEFAQPNAILLTKTWAEKCFGSVEAALHKTVLLDNLFPLTVAGVLKDLPTNCDFAFPFLVSYETIKGKEDYFYYGDHWGSISSNDQMYVLLEQNLSLAQLNASLATVGKEEYSEDGIQENQHFFQPLSDLHYNEELGHNGRHTTSRGRLKVLALIGLLILIMACFNFINLANAQATLRAKEVGVRKTLGGHRGQLAGQFLTETSMIVFISVAMGIVMAYMGLPLLQKVSQVPPSQPLLQGWESFAFLGVLAASIVVLAGLYPSLALASFRPVEALKNKIQSAAFGATSVRKALVVLQFVIAQALIISIIIALVQLDYIRTQDMGFEEDLVYTFGYNSDSLTLARQSALKQSLLQLPEVEAVSLNSDQPFSGSTWTTNFAFHDRPEDEDFGITMKFCDADYQKTYQIDMAAGRWLQPSDTMREAVVNELLVGMLGLGSADELIGKTVKANGRKLDIVGVTEDFHAHSFRDAHLPLLMSTRKEYYWDAGVRVRPDKATTAVAAIQGVFDRILPEQIFDGRYFEENIAQFYEDDEKLATACWGFGLLAIFICCLGLFGLAAHAASRRTKEIGIRKVLGARVLGIISMLSRDFILLVVFAFLLAAPLAWYFMNQWLNDFVFRIDIPWWSYVLAGVLTISIAFITVGIQTSRAALANPIDSLRNE